MNTNKIILLISFRGVTGKVITDIANVGDVVKANNKHGIDSIKEFDATKDKFVRVSKEQIVRWFSFDTHAMVELQKTGYIK